MRLLRCPKGYIGTRVDELDIVIDKLADEERGYTLVDDHVASELLKRDGYEEILTSAYPRNLELLRAKVQKQLLQPGVLTGEPQARVETLPRSIRREAEQHLSEHAHAAEHAPAREGVKHGWFRRLTRLFRRGN